MRELVRLVAAWVLVWAMVGCGGGGGGNSPPGVTGPLAGDAASPAAAAIVDVAPQPAAEADVVMGVILTRLNVALEGDATVGQVNAALTGVGATIAAAQAGVPMLSIAVPRQADRDALFALAATLQAQPGILAALPGLEAMANLSPPSGAAGDADFLYLQRARFPAAWNARAAAGNCASSRVKVIVADGFVRPRDVLYAQFPGQVPDVTDLGSGTAPPPPGGQPELHGYDVLTTLAAKLDATVPTGAIPFPECLELKAIGIRGLDTYAIISAIAAELAASGGKAVVNASFGWDGCGTPAANGTHPPCTAANLNAPTAFQRAVWGAFQRQSLGLFADRALVVTSAGNEADKPVGAAYQGTSIAGFSSAFNVAASADDTMSFASTAPFWDPTLACSAAPCLPSLTASAADMANLARLLPVLGPNASRPAQNVLIAGSVDNLLLQRSTFSDPGAPVLAVGEGIPTLLGVPVQGTSFAAPQVAALAAYLWLLSPELRARPAADTVAAIKANASNGVVIDGVSIADGLINAYATVLSLDEPVAVTPATAKIRLAILDVAGALDANSNVVGDGRFDLADLQAFRALYLDAAGAPIEPSTRDHSRFDLNGDGFTGGSRPARMDLDPNGSTRFGAPLLSSFSRPVAGVPMTFDELAVTDAQALCFYATSALYTGTDPAARDALLGPLCFGGSGGTSDCGLGPGSYALTGSLTRSERTATNDSQLAVNATLCVHPTGRSIEITAMSGTRSANVTFVGTDPLLTGTCAATIDVAVQSPPQPVQLSRYSSLALPASGPSTSGNLFAAMLQTCQLSDGTTTTAGVVGPVGTGTHVIVSGRIVAIDFAFSNSEVTVQGRLQP
jgi:hypothetical protein